MYKFFLWLLKLGTLLNLYLFSKTLIPPLVFADIHILIPAQIFFIVSAFRCFFPVSYVSSAVLHDSLFSSIFLTRLLATFSEVAYIYQFSYLLRLFNADQIPLVDVLSWLMVVQVVISQFFVWGAILTGRQKLYFYEELGWGIIFIINTIASIILYWTLDILSGYKVLLQINILFGTVYLPWQLVHLRALLLKAKDQGVNENIYGYITGKMLIIGLKKSIKIKILTTKLEDWGGVIGMMWMAAYWAILIPVWIYLIVLTV